MVQGIEIIAQQFLNLKNQTDSNDAVECLKIPWSHTVAVFCYPDRF